MCYLRTPYNILHSPVHRHTTFKRDEERLDSCEKQLSPQGWANSMLALFALPDDEIVLHICCTARRFGLSGWVSGDQKFDHRAGRYSVPRPGGAWSTAQAQDQQSIVTVFVCTAAGAR